jgi:hypothetical protein
LIFSLAHAPVWSATIYVDPTCTDGVAYVPATRACTGGSDTVKDTVTEGVAALSAGDHLFVRGGTVINAGFSDSVPNGTGATGRTVASAYPVVRDCTGYNLTAAEWDTCMKTAVYEDVTLKGSQAGIEMEGDRSWIVIEGFKFPGPHRSNFPVRVACTGSFGTNPPTCDTGVTAVCPANIVIAGNTVQNSTASSFIGHAHTSVWVIGNKISNCGSDGLDHCMYWTGINSMVLGNEMSGSLGTGSQYYRQVTQPTCYPRGDGMLIAGNYYHDNTLCGTVIAGWNGGATYQNNISVRNSCGLSINSGQSEGHLIYSNTLIDNGTDVKILSGGDNATLKNNVYGSISIDAGATGVVQENNYLACSTCTQPAFRDRNNSDYHPLPTDTVLVGQGANLMVLHGLMAHKLLAPLKWPQAIRRRLILV